MSGYHDDTSQDWRANSFLSQIGVSYSGDRIWGPVTQVAVAYAVEMGSGRAFVWGDEWIEFDSEWSSLPQIPKLWLQVFSWIAPANRCALTGIG